MKLIKHSNKKNVLVSYVLTPTVNVRSYFLSSNNNKLISYTIVKALFEYGYNIYLYDYLDENINFKIKYDLFFGHNITFSNICAKLSNECKKVLIITGSAPSFGNIQQKLRDDYLFSRKGIRIGTYDDNFVPNLDSNFEKADKILMLGNDFVLSTYPSTIHHKVNLLNNISLLPIERKKKVRTNNFIFVSSVGQVHRGLDLVLDVFSKRKEHIYICSDFKNEPEFEKLYYNELYYNNNISSLGFINLNSKKVKKILDCIDFVILPSCSEGQSGSILNMMFNNIIPIILPNVGFSDVESYGIVIEEATINGISNAVNRAINLTDNEIAEKRNSLAKQLKNHSLDSFKEQIQKLLL